MLSFMTSHHIEGEKGPNKRHAQIRQIRSTLAGCDDIILTAIFSGNRGSATTL